MSLHVQFAVLLLLPAVLPLRAATLRGLILANEVGGAACVGFNACSRRCLSPSFPCRPWRSLSQARTVCAIDMALLTELCPQASTPFRL